jgi:hypothetical protein
MSIFGYQVLCLLVIDRLAKRSMECRSRSRTDPVREYDRARAIGEEHPFRLADRHSFELTPFGGLLSRILEGRTWSTGNSAALPSVMKVGHSGIQSGTGH